MNKRSLLATMMALSIALPAFAEEVTHDVKRGDTLWGISGQYKGDPKTWPKLWSDNPQVKNPHWISPGDKIYLYGQKEPAQPAEVEVRLPVEKLEPPKPEPVVAEQAAPAEEAKPAEATAQPLAPKIYQLVSSKVQDYIAEAPVDSLAVVANATLVKIASAKDEDIDFFLHKGKTLAVGDKVTFYDDSKEVINPQTGKVAGRHVRVLGYGSVVSLDGEKGRIKVIESYDAITDGVMVAKLAGPIREVTVTSAPAGLKGLVLGGRESNNLFAESDVVFLDKGTNDGLMSGALVEIHLKDAPRLAEGMASELSAPISRLLVVSSQAKTSTALVVNSRMVVEPGQLFEAVAVSP